MEVTYVRQSLTNLRFGLYNRPLDPNLFRVLRQRSVEQPHYRAELWVIGTSHVMNFRLTSPDRPDEAALAEVLTGAGGALPSAGKMEEVRKFGERQGFQHQVGRLNYTTQIDSWTYPEEEFLRRNSRLLTESVPHRLCYPFPQEAGLVAAPLTVIDVLRADEAALAIRTFHTYPEEWALIVTHSSVEIAPIYADRQKK